MRKRKRRTRRTRLKHGPDPAKWRAEYAAALRDNVQPPPDMVRVQGATTPPRGVMARLHEEPPKVRQEIERKARMVAPAFNKGALQYVIDKDS